MTLQFPTPQFVGEAVRYQNKSWVWDGTAWHLDDVANRLDLATIPAYLGQFVYKIGAVPPTFISLATPDLFGASFVLSSVPPLEGIKVYKNGVLLVLDGGVGTPGQYVVNRAANRIEFLVPLLTNDIITIGVLTPQDRLAPGRVDVQPIKDLDTDWVTNPGSPTTGMVNGVRRTFDLLIDVAGVGQTFAVIAKNADLAVFVGGVRQRPGVDYTTVGSKVTMTIAPVAGVPFWALWYMPAGAATGGGGVTNPQPPLDGRLLFYGWRPGTGAGWQDDRGGALTVANAAARTALRADIDIFAGTLVLQADTQVLWRWTGTAWARYLDAGIFTARLGGTMQILRSSTAAARPAVDSGLPGELWLNTNAADKTFGYFDDGNDPVELFGLDAANRIRTQFFSDGMRPLGTVNPGSIALTDWNNAHLTGTAPVRAPAGVPNRPPGPDLPFAGHYIAMGDADTGVLIVMSPAGNTVYARARNAGVWAAWVQVNSPGLDLSSAMLRANNLSDVVSKPAGRTNLDVMFNPRAFFTGDLNLLDETGLYALGIGVTNGWTNDGTGAGGEATVGDAVLHIETGGTLAYQLGFNVIPTGPAAKPLRLRFMIGPTTWTPWASVATTAEVTAEINAAIAAAVAALPPGTHVGTTPPASPDQGQLWFKTASPVGLFIWFEDGDSSQWVQTGGGGGGGGGGAAVEFATDAEAIAGVITNKAMSPATTRAVLDDLGVLTPLDIVKGASGWQVVGDVLIQWGSVVTAANPTVLTFPREFKTPPRMSATVGNTLDCNATAFPTSTTQAAIRSFVQSGAFTAGLNVDWIAIGEALDADKMPKTVGTASGADFATPAEALEGVRTDVVMSPATTRSAIPYADDAEAIDGVITDKVMSPATTKAANRLKAWLAFNGTGNADIDGDNLTGVRTATGEFTFTFGTPLPNNKYAVTVGLGSTGGGFGAHVITNKTVNGFQLVVNRIDVATVRSNPATIDLAVFQR